MPRFDGSYPTLGIEYDPSADFEDQLLPQVECDFGPFAPHVLGGATPLTTNGSRGSDPAVFMDLSDASPLGSVAYVSDGLLSNQTQDQPCIFSCIGLKVCSGGSGIQVKYRPQNIQSLNEYIELRMLNNSGDGYLARLDKSTLSIRLVTSDIAITLKSVLLSATSEGDFSFMWDGGSRFRAAWGDSFIAEVDDTFNVSDFILSVKLNNAKISKFIAGVSAGSKTFDVDATQRDAGFGNVTFYENGKFPWPIVGAMPIGGADDAVFLAAHTKMVAANLVPFVTLAYAPPEYAAPGGAPDPTKAQNICYAWSDILTDYPNLNDFIVWKDNYGMRCGIDAGSSSYWATPGCTGDGWDYARYKDLYQKVYTTFTAKKPGVRLYGPNCHLSARGAGYDTLYGGVLVDSRDMNFLQMFINDIDAATPPFAAAGVAISGSFTPSEWEDLIPELKTMCGTHPLVITSPPPIATPTQADLDAFFVAGNNQLDSGDILFADFTGFRFMSPRTPLRLYDWQFTATLVIHHQMRNAKLKVATISDKILLNPAIRIESSHATPYVLSDELPSGNGHLLLGHLEEGTYFITIFGDRGVSGTATLRIGIHSDNFDVLTLADTKLLGVP